MSLPLYCLLRAISRRIFSASALSRASRGSLRGDRPMCSSQVGASAMGTPWRPPPAGGWFPSQFAKVAALTGSSSPRTVLRTSGTNARCHCRRCPRLSPAKYLMASSSSSVFAAAASAVFRPAFWSAAVALGLMPDFCRSETGVPLERDIEALPAVQNWLVGPPVGRGARGLDIARTVAVTEAIRHLKRRGPPHRLLLLPTPQAPRHDLEAISSDLFHWAGHLLESSVACISMAPQWHH